MTKRFPEVLAVFSLCLFLSCTKDDKEAGTPVTAVTGTLVGTIVDRGTDEPVLARVYVTGSDSTLYLAEECLPYEQPQYKSRIGYSGAHFTTTGGTFTVKLPAGKATVRIERGKEYVPLEEAVLIAADETVTRTFVISRWIDMASRGWYSGDLHVHRSPGDMKALMQAEDLDIASVQTVWGLKREPGLDRWLAQADDDGVIHDGDTRMFSVLSHEIERMRNSAVLFHHTGKTIIPVAEYEERGLPNIPLVKIAREAGGYIEAEKPWWPESHIDIALGKADFTGIANNHLTYESYLPEHARKRTEFRDDYPEGMRGYVDYTLDIYYAYLDCGLRVMPTAGSASGVLPNPLGYNRVYVEVEGDFTYDNWFASLKKGRCFVTNGPLLFMTVDGHETGDTVTADAGTVNVTCEVHSLVPIEKLEIVCNGEIMLTVAPSLTDHKAAVVASVTVDRSGWIVARCFEKEGDTLRFAHTAPVFLDVPGKSFTPRRYAVEYFLRKTNELIVRAETGEYPSDESRNATMDVYQGAKALFEELLEKSD